MSPQAHIRGILTKNTGGYSSRQGEQSKKVVQVGVGNGRYFRFVNTFTERGRENHPDQFEWADVRGPGHGVTSVAVDIIPTQRAMESYERFKALSDAAGDVRILDPWVEMRKDGLPNKQTMAGHVMTTDAEGRILKQAMDAYLKNHSFETALAVVHAFHACKRK